MLKRVNSGDFQSDELIEAIEVLAPPNGTSEDYDPVILAEFCAAAGEVMRVSRLGSESRTSAYLLTALRHAQEKYEPDLAARIAYRFAMSVHRSAASPNGRSARGELRAVLASDGKRPTPPPGMGDICGLLFSDQFDCETRRYATQASFDCALVNSRSACDFEIGALSQLQIARNALSEAERCPLMRNALRVDAARAARSGIALAIDIKSASSRFNLASRLVESAFDAGSGDSPEIRDGLALLEGAVSDDPRERAMLSAMQGRLLLAAGNNQAAAAAFRRAAYFESAREQPLRLADWYLLLAKAEPEARRSHMQVPYRALESVCPLMPLSDPLTEESTFALRMQPVFKAVIEEQLDAAAESGDSSYIRVAQQIVETFRQAEIQSTFGQNCVPPRDPIDPKNLQAGEILLYPILLDDRVELLVATAQAPDFTRLQPVETADRDRVGMLVGQMVYSIAYGEDDAWEAASAELYQILIAPIEDRLGENSTLVIIPDGALRMLPFAALKNRRGGLLIERTRLSVAPALAYAQPGSRNEGNLEVVAASLEQAVDLPAGIFPALNGTSKEARLGARIDQTEKPHGIFLENFDRASLQGAFLNHPVDVPHLATHATFNGRSERSFIVASDGALMLLQPTTVLRRLAASVSLSAARCVTLRCQTVRGYRETLLLADTGVNGSIEIAQIIRLARDRGGFAWGSFTGTVFVDGALVHNREGPQSKPGEIASIGGSLTWMPSSAINARVSYGRALNSPQLTGQRDLQDRGVEFSIMIRPLEF